MGFDEFNRNYLVFNYETHKLVVTHKVAFDETCFSEKGDEPSDTFVIEEESEKEHQDKNEPTTLVEDGSSEESDHEEPPPNDAENSVTRIKVIPPKPPLNHPDHPDYVRRSTRISQLPKRSYLTGKDECFNAEILDPKFEPRSFKDVHRSGYKDKWTDACKKEIDGFEKLHVFTLVDRPANRKVIRG
ncbi:hypothetical protein PGTUg99_006989 [Puccinia graminis f. sp. tritici]|uniref:Uncharacterized protein n=1 Tax=Puccinia graminis f. sp. tritici TaxID=56615 RepID=A0A5B0M473_PUCGR|nr:hypothetical protein PGTUg99_006989 [Puccinia graminis f. sp. tritici]